VVFAGEADLFGGYAEPARAPGVIAAAEQGLVDKRGPSIDLGLVLLVGPFE
jgi:hypothetical protein